MLGHELPFVILKSDASLGNYFSSCDPETKSYDFFLPCFLEIARTLESCVLLPLPEVMSSRASLPLLLLVLSCF